MKSKLNRRGFHKRSGAPANEVVYALMVWVWLKVNLVGMFARESLKTYSQASKDALYAALNHEGGTTNDESAKSIASVQRLCAR